MAVKMQEFQELIGGEPLWRATKELTLFVSWVNVSEKGCNRRLPGTTQGLHLSRSDRKTVETGRGNSSPWVIRGSRLLPSLREHSR